MIHPSVLSRMFRVFSYRSTWLASNKPFSTKPIYEEEKLHKLDEKIMSDNFAERQTNLILNYQKYPEMLDYPESTLINYVKKMGEVGVTKDVSCQMLLKYPAVLKISQQKIAQTVMALRSIGFKEEPRSVLLSEHPRLVEVPGTEIVQRIAFLQSYFDNPTEALDAILQSVECLVEKEIVVRRKLEYLIKDASHETKSIKNCNVLSFSLKHIIIRHEFLIRSGIFKPIPYRKLIKVLEREKSSKTGRLNYFNPFEVVCTTDSKFLKICTKGAFTLNDLAAFEEIFVNHPRETKKDLNNFDIFKFSIHNKDKDDEYDIDEDDNEDTSTRNSLGYASLAESKDFYF